MMIFYAFLVIFKFLALPSDDQSEIALHPFLSFCNQSNRLSSFRISVEILVQNF